MQRRLDGMCAQGKGGKVRESGALGSPLFLTRMCVVEPGDVVCVAHGRQPPHLVEQVEQPGRDASLLLADERDGRRVVGPHDALPRDALRVVQRLLRGEDVRIERRLQLLVRKVDQQLVEPVPAVACARRLDCRGGRARRLWRRGARHDCRRTAERISAALELTVDEADGPLEERRVDALGERVARMRAARRVERKRHLRQKGITSTTTHDFDKNLWVITSLEEPKKVIRQSL
eukprot:4265177-Pleurochrysis_carterae.AAC.2